MILCDILIFMAMQDEASRVIKLLQLTPFHLPDIQPLPAICFSGNYQGLKILLATPGSSIDRTYDYVGTQFAALTAWSLLKTCNPKLILNLGTAGGFIKRGAKIGDIYINTLGCQYHDRHISIESYREFCEKQIPSFTATKLFSHLVGLKPGLISTGNSLDPTPTEIDYLIKTQANVKDMEAAAVAEVAALFGKDIVALKAITDCLDGLHPSAEEFLQNLHFSSDKLAQMLCVILNFLAKHPEIL